MDQAPEIDFIQNFELNRGSRIFAPTLQKQISFHFFVNQSLMMTFFQNFKCNAIIYNLYY